MLNVYVNQSEVKCPFYRADDGIHQIRCEGSGLAVSQTMYIKYKAEFAVQMKTYCCSKYEKCPQYMAVIEKYGGD